MQQNNVWCFQGLILYKFSLLQNKNRSNALAAAKKVVNQWVEAGKSKVKYNKANGTGEMDRQKLDVTAINQSAIEALAKVSPVNLQYCNPVFCNEYTSIYGTE